jgi:hypothetical protein
LVGIILLALLCSVLSGQEFRATISGHVIDSSGGAVPNVKIEAINLGTNEVTRATTDTSGSYTIPFLRPGAYKVTATATGFKQFVRDQVVLEAARATGIDVRLEVGAVTETVEVTAEALALETQSATRSGIVTTQQVAEMPLNARNPFMLGAMMSGVTFNGAAIWQRPFDNGAIAEWSMNGGRNSSSEFLMDGASNNGQMGNNNVAAVPIVDAVQEFNIMTNMYNSEYGRTGSGIMNVVLKSGTSKHHGTAYEFLRRTSLDANTFQNNAIVASAANPTGGAKRPTHYLDQYGFQVEGPVMIPKILTDSSKVKLFYMGALELYREGTPNPLVLSYPEPEMRTGDFSKLKNNVGQAITIYDPFTASYDAAGNVITARTAFPGNVIPATRLNPIAQAVTKHMPLPNQPSAANSRYSNSNLYLPDYFDKDKFYNLIMKFDMNFGDKHRAFVRHLSNDRTEDRSSNGIDNKPGTDGQQPFQRINDAYVADWITTISPTFIVNVRGSFNRFIEKGFGRANEGFDMSSLGISKSLLSQLPSPVYFGRWNFDNGYASMGRGQSNNFSNTYELMGSATKILGSHTVKAGFDLRQINYLLQNTGDILQFSGNTGWTQRVWNQGDAISGDGYASFLLGIVGGSSNYPLFPWWRQYYAAMYLHDDWKVSRRLTLNLGLRYDLNYPNTEKWNRMNGPFDPKVASPIVSQISPDMLARYPQLQSLKGGLTFAGVGGIGGRPFAVDKNNLQPRLGLAYQVNEKLVLRTGFGQYYSNPTNAWQQTNGFSTSTSLVNSNNSGRTPIANVLSNPYPNNILTPVGSSQGAATFVGRNPTWFDPGYQVPSVWQFSFGFQYQATKSSMLDISYVGSRSYNLNMERDYNNPSLAVRKTCNWLEGGRPSNCDATVPNPFKGIPIFNGTSWYTADTVSTFQMQRPHPQFSGNLLQTGRNDSSMWYNSLQVNYNWRTRGGITLLANYTWSKQMEQWGLNDPYTDTYGQSLYFLDRPHVIKLTTVWELPFGKGKRFGSGATGVWDRLISGWELTNFMQDPLKGFPADLPGNVIPLKDYRQAGGPFKGGEPDWKAYQVYAWNPCVLRQDQNSGVIAPTPNSLALGCGSDYSNNWGNYAWLWTAGYAPRYTDRRSPTVRRHHAIQLDASLLKKTKINERLSFQFGVEAFNLMNHNYFGRDQYNTDPNSSNFGSIRPSTVSTQNILPRQIQMRFKFYW